MSAAESPSLPSGWQFNANALGGVDLRVPDPRNLRKRFAAVVAILAALAGWRTLVNWHMGLNGSAPVLLVMTVLLSLFAIWCALVDDRWRIEKNCLERRLSIGRFLYSSHYRDAELEIVLRFLNSRPYYRLYVIANGQSHFLIERDENALRQLAGFISFHTGWPVRPLQPPPGIAVAMRCVEEMVSKDGEDDRGRGVSDS
jgi:hypothetical protein